MKVTRWDDVVMADIDRLRLEYGLIELLRGELVLDRLLIEDPFVRVETLPDGQLDWIRALGIEPSDEPPVAWAGMDFLVTLSALELDRGEVLYVQSPAPDAPPAADGTPAQPFEFAVKDLRARAAAQLGGGARATIRDVAIEALPGPYDEVFLTGGLRYEKGTVTPEDLALYMGGTRLLLSGKVDTVELDPTLDVRLQALPLGWDTATPFAGQVVLREDINVDAQVRGPLRDLGVGLSATARSAGGLTLQAHTDLEAEPLTWMAEVRTDSLHVDRLVAFELAEPVQLAGRYAVEGSGTAWPEGVQAHLEADAPKQILYGQEIGRLLVEADLAEGQLTFSRASARHPVGEVSITGGSVDLVGETADLRLDGRLPSLSGLREFGLVGYRGAVSAKGPVEVAWGGEEPVVNTTLAVTGSNIGSADFSLARVSSGGVRVSVVGSAVRWSGAARLEGLEASGVTISALDVRELAGGYDPSGAVDTRAELGMGRLEVGDGTFVLEGLTGPVSGGVSAKGQPYVDTEGLMLGAMNIEPINYRLDGGPVVLHLEDDVLFADLTLRRNERVVLKTVTRGELGAGRWRVEELLVFPAEARGFANPEATPIEFTLAEEGVKDVSLVLVLSGQDPEALNPRQLELEKASYITLQGGTAGELPDITVKARRVELGWVSSMLNLFLSESKDEPFIAEMSGAVDLDLTTEGLDEAATLRGEVALRDFVLPEVADGVTATAVASGTLGRPRVTVDLESTEGKLLALAAEVPLDMEVFSLKCEDELAVRALLAPTELDRLQARLPALSGLPEGEASADVHLRGPACDPDIRIVGAFAGPVGAQGEYGRADLIVDRSARDLTVEGFLEEAGVRRLEISGEAENHLTEVMAWAIGGGPEPDLEDPDTYLGEVNFSVVPLDVPLSLLAQLAGSPAQVSGRLLGGVNLSGELSDPQLAGGLMIVEGQLGSTRIDAANVGLVPGSEGGRDGYALSTLLDFGDDGALSVDGFAPVTVADAMEGTEGIYESEGWRLAFSGPGVPLEVLNGTVEGVQQADGQLRLTGTLGGRLDDLQSALQVEVVDGRLWYMPLSWRWRTSPSASIRSATS